MNEVFQDLANFKQVVRDFLMQCFQKDHNLRVSARKLLKHPWIVNARRSDSIVPKKPTAYEEAVKSVQQWNEALKSPNASVRKASRPVTSSPVPPRRERPLPLATPARSNLSLAKPRAIAEQFRSPATASDDNWDNDFASAITPSALQLPHLKPQDHFGGMLSAEKLKTFASFETVTEEANWDDNFEGDLTVKSPMQVTTSDPLKTVRPYFSERANTQDIKTSAPTKSPKRKTPQAIERSASRLDAPPKKSKPEATSQQKPTLQYREDPVEDYSDLVLANDGDFEKKLVLNKVSSLSFSYLLDRLIFVRRPTRFRHSSSIPRT